MGSLTAGDWWRCAGWIRVWAGIQQIQDSEIPSPSFVSCSVDKVEIGTPKIPKHILKKLSFVHFVFLPKSSQMSNKIHISMSSQWHSWGPVFCPGAWYLILEVATCPTWVSTASQLHYTTLSKNLGFQPLSCRTTPHLQLSHKFEENMLNLQQWVRISLLDTSTTSCL